MSGVPSQSTVGKGEVSAVASAAVRVGVYGALGRMGQMVVRTLLAPPEGSDMLLALCAALVETTNPHLGRDIGPLVGLSPVGVSASSDMASALRMCQVIIDFSTPAATAILAPAAAAAGVAMVIGTTGLHQPALTAISAAAELVPVVHSANMSPGINVILGLLRRAAAVLPDYDAEIIEIHHRGKRDAPSGTAMLLADALDSSRGRSGVAPSIIRTGRDGMSGPRPRDEIGVLAVRGGDVAGDHTVMLLGTGERVELTHRASSREVFAQGALRAARWVVGQPPRLYDMEDMLGLK
jgi:4-hydroxy-tetrahydrodipicolinate reductase